MERKVLGKGLDALIPKKTVAVESENEKEIMCLPLDMIKSGKYQPRREIGGNELDCLAQSIKEKGFIQPIVVRKIEAGQYEIVAGGRRFEAAKALRLKEIPVMVKSLDDCDTLIVAIVENLQRKELNPIEEADSFKRLMWEFEFSLEDIAKFVGKDKTTVANTLRLLRLPEEIKEAVRKGVLTRSQARTILGAEKKEDQENLFQMILKKGLSVREIEHSVKKISVKKKKSMDPFVIEVEEKLQKFLGTKVRVFNRKKNKGKVVVEYYSLEDLERIVDRLA
ncbi:MAG: ParB/RepB/Spo0J family partition protein [Candidatus Omnitrophota bacterium]|nr:ParB/RepB/Spo0J family partition protein [Candidatus Omnitrophota bacterium]